MNTLSIADLQSELETLYAGEDKADARLMSQFLDALEAGSIRAAEPGQDGTWNINEWVKKGILLYFRSSQNVVMESGDIRYFDKIPVRADVGQMGARIVPPAVARRGAFIGRNAILMPSYVNIGAYVGERTMVDTWATVGSCAQIGADVHLSGGVGIGGVLEPLQAAPVIVEDGAFIGSRCILVEGVRVGREAVLGANVVITGSTKILDVTGPEVVEYRGFVPPRSVVIPGAIPKKFVAGEFSVPCALIIGQRKESTDKKTSLNAALREYEIS